MTGPLNQILAKQHVADLMADADRHRERRSVSTQTATGCSGGDAGKESSAWSACV